LVPRNVSDAINGLISGAQRLVSFIALGIEYDIVFDY